MFTAIWQFFERIFRKPDSDRWPINIVNLEEHYKKRGRLPPKENP